MENEIEISPEWGTRDKIKIYCMAAEGRFKNDKGEEFAHAFEIEALKIQKEAKIIPGLVVLDNFAHKITCKFCNRSLILRGRKDKAILSDANSMDEGLRSKIFNLMNKRHGRISIGIVMLLFGATLLIFSVFELFATYFGMKEYIFLQLHFGFYIVGCISGFIIGVVGLNFSVLGIRTLKYFKKGKLRTDRIYLVGEDFYEQIVDDSRAKWIHSKLYIYNSTDNYKGTLHAVSIGETVGENLFESQLYSDQQIPPEAVDFMDSDPVFTKSLKSSIAVYNNNRYPF